jgi:hypothetical protein
MSSSSWTHLDVSRIVRKTERAMLIQLEHTGDQVWIPLSQVSDEEGYSEGDVNCTVSISEWFADKEGITNGDE